MMCALPRSSAQLSALGRDPERPGDPKALGFTRSLAGARRVTLSPDLASASGATHRRGRVDVTDAGDLVWTT